MDEKWWVVGGIDKTYRFVASSSIGDSEVVLGSFSSQVEAQIAFFRNCGELQKKRPGFGWVSDPELEQGKKQPLPLWADKFAALLRAFSSS